MNAPSTTANKQAAEQHVRDQMTMYMAANQHVIHGITIARNGENDLNEVYYTLDSAYTTMIAELKANKILRDTVGDVTENFMVLGFPRHIPNFTQVDYIQMYIERHTEPAPTWSVRIVFHFLGDSFMTYVTTITA